MNIKDAQKCFDLVLNEQSSLAGQYPEGNYYGEFAVICKKYDIDPETHWENVLDAMMNPCLLYTSPSPRDKSSSRMPSSA